MRIGIDIDDTVTKTDERYQKYLKKYCRAKKMDYYKGLKLNKNEYLTLLKSYEREVFEKVKPKKDAAKILRKWYKSGYEIYFITAREKEWFNDIEKITINYLSNLKIPYKKIFFSAKNKYEVSKSLNLDVYIDDQEKVLDAFPKNNLLLIRVVTNKKYYSKYQKATTWKEIDELVSREV